jgi:radical SAM protein with 4Fe4S-binding SPASM domain
MIRVEHMKNLKNGIVFWRIDNGQGIISDLEENKQYQCDNEVISFLEGKKSNLDNSDTEFLNKYILDDIDQTELFKKMIEEKKKLPFKGIIYIDTGRRCNLRCIGCFNNSGSWYGDEMTPEVAKKAAGLLEKIGKPNITITGGEPLILKRWDEVIGSFSKKFNTTIFSNGTLITKDVASKLKELNVASIKVSLDGAAATVHDKLRGVNGAYQKTIEGIRNLVDVGIYTIIQSTISKINIDQVEGLVELANKLDANEIRFSPLRDIGRASENDITPSQQELFEMAKRVEKYKAENKVNLIVLEGEAFCEKDEDWRKELYKSNEFSEKEKQYINFVRSSACDVGIDRFQIHYNGDITFCPLITGESVKIGNINGIKSPDELIELFYNNPISKVLQKPLVEQQACKFCGLKYLCGGGCRGEGFAVTGKVDVCDHQSNIYLTDVLTSVKA